MKAPTHFFLGLVAGVALAFGIYFWLFYSQLGAPTQLSYWCYDINTRKLARAASIHEPKLLVVGGSATLFGVNARLLEKQLGVPTVNFGTHAALGTAYILDLARRAAKPGDTVLLTLEFELLELSRVKVQKLASTIFLDYLIARDPDYFRSLPLWMQLDMAMRLPTHRIEEGLHNKRHPPPPPTYPEFTVYDPRLVDDYGDMTGHVAARIPPDAPKELQTSGILARGLPEKAAGLDEIRDFCAWARRHGVRVLATFPNICHQPAYDTPKTAETAQAIKAFYRKLGVPFVGTLKDVMLPRDEFFDTNYHLTKEAAADRTRRLATNLAPFFADAPGRTRSATTTQAAR